MNTRYSLHLEISQFQSESGHTEWCDFENDSKSAMIAEAARWQIQNCKSWDNKADALDEIDRWAEGKRLINRDVERLIFSLIQESEDHDSEEGNR